MVQSEKAGRSERSGADRGAAGNDPPGSLRRYGPHRGPSALCSAPAPAARLGRREWPGGTRPLPGYCPPAAPQPITHNSGSLSQLHNILRSSTSPGLFAAQFGAGVLFSSSSTVSRAIQPTARGRTASPGLGPGCSQHSLGQGVWGGQWVDSDPTTARPAQICPRPHGNKILNGTRMRQRHRSSSRDTSPP